MPIKDLLVHVDAGVAAPARVELGVSLARTHGAHLTGIHVLSLPPIPSYVLPQLPQSVLDMQLRTLEEESERLKAMFIAKCDAGGVNSEWRQVRGDTAEAVELHSRYSDCVLIGQASKDDPGDDLSEEMPEDLALHVGRPVLIVPCYGSFSKIGDRVLVAWNGTREATRAINDAIPFINKAHKVTVLVINPEEMASRHMPGADISLHLARHGIDTEAATARADDIEVGDIILSRAADLGADLIVMGAYGHSRFREMVMGGATRHILRHMTVPVLMSH